MPTLELAKSEIWYLPLSEQSHRKPRVRYLRAQDPYRVLDSRDMRQPSFGYSLAAKN
jgi:hypothetical protein